MFKMNSLVGVVPAGTAGLLTVESQADAAVITFDGVVNGQVMPGETIGSTAEVSVSYEGDFRGWANADGYFSSGFGSSGPVIYASGAEGVGTITFTANPGLEVRLDSLVLGIVMNGSENSLLEYSLDEGVTWTEVPTSIAAGSAGLVEFTGVQAPIVKLRRYDQDPSNPAGESDAGIDNITFTVVPEPGSLALLGLGGVMILRRRRSA